MTIVERALQLVPDNSLVGLGSGRAAQAFVQSLGQQVRAGNLRVRAVPTSQQTASLASEAQIPLVSLEQAGVLDIAVDGADEVDPNLDLIKGYGRALVREKIVAQASHLLVILVGTEKIVPTLGTRGKLPVEVLPFGLPLVEKRLRQLGCHPIRWMDDGQLLMTDNGNYILDCTVAPIVNPGRLESQIRAIPGVVGTGLFVGMADVVLIGGDDDFQLIEEKRRPGSKTFASF
jgi:ribose 5-phosphate isomerase A